MNQDFYEIHSHVMPYQLHFKHTHFIPVDPGLIFFYSSTNFTMTIALRINLFMTLQGRWTIPYNGKQNIMTTPNLI